MGSTPLSARVMGRIRRLAPNRVVHHEVQGVSLAMPWSHRLPDYARTFPQYGQNLVALAAALATEDPELGVIDVGANIGDSALQILQVAPGARVLCVEGDEYWLRFLTMNVGRNSHVTVVPALVVDAIDESELVAVRAKGTTRFVAGEGGSMPQVSGHQLRASTGFEGLRLIKSDTDGYDTRIVPALAEAWADVTPVLFVEYDPRLTRLAGDAEPLAVWSRLAALGYVDAVVWDNTGGLIGAMTIQSLTQRALEIDKLPAGDDRYWDVALAHGDDVAGRAALRTVAQEALS